MYRVQRMQNQICELIDARADDQRAIAALHERIAVQDSKLAAINNAAELLIASVQANQGMLDEADEARLAFIRLESDPTPEKYFDKELPEEVIDFLARLTQVTK